MNWAKPLALNSKQKVKKLETSRFPLQTDNPEAPNTVYNVAYGARTSLNKLADILKNLLSAHDPAIADVPILHGPERIGDIPHSQASIEKASKLLKYSPKYNLEDGLKEAVEWYRENLAL